MNRAIILSTILAAGLSIIILKAYPDKQRALHPNQWPCQKRRKKDILDIYED